MGEESSAVKYIGIVPLDNESKYQFRINYAAELGRKKKATMKENRAMLIKGLKEALEFLESDEELTETGFSGFGRANVWIEGK